MITRDEDLAPTLAAVGDAQLVRFLSTRRWFDAKGRAVASAGLRDIAPLSGELAALACVRVHFADGSRADYQLPLAVRPAADAPDADEVERSGDLRVVDATSLPEFRRRLGRAFARRETCAGTPGRWSFEPVGDPDDFGELPSRVVGGEQSNTSIVFGDRVIVKLLRRVEPGVHPDVEVVRFLTTRTRFRGTPPLLGVAVLRGEGDPGVAAIAQAFMPGAVDGWSHALARLRAGEDLTAELTALGAVTRELHDALASAPDDPDFAPQPTTPADLERWQAATAAQATLALDRLAQAPLPPDLRPVAARVLAARAALVADLRRPLAADVGPRTRLHGDYHLGQVLHTPAGWRIIDFEGEPARPLAERRARHHPLRDVAGMLRSFAYAAAVAAPAAAPAMQAAFLAGYDPSLADDPRRRDLLALLLAEKLFYELAYELGSRPDWVAIPLADVAARLPAEAA